jgi:hypothetical protein
MDMDPDVLAAAANSLEQKLSRLLFGLMASLDEHEFGMLGAALMKATANIAVGMKDGRMRVPREEFVAYAGRFYDKALSALGAREKP